MKTIKIILSFLALLSFSSCGIIKPIEFKDFKNISVTKDFNIKVEGDLALYNPNSVNINVSKLDIDVFIENVNLGKIEVPNGLILLKKQTTETHVAVNTSLAKILASAPQILNIITKGSFEVRLKGTLYPESLYLPATVVINHKVNVKL